MKDVIVKVSGVIIKDKKLLLVSGNNRPFYWTPGGKLNTGETALEALKREFYEELQAVVVLLFICYKTGEKPEWRWGGK